MQSMRVAIIMVFNPSGELYVTKRSKLKKNHPGLYEIGQGGKLHDGENFEQAGKRELFEELGIKGVALDYLFDFTFSSQKEVFDSRVYACKYGGKMKLKKDEIEEGFFTSLDGLRRMVEKNPEDFTPESAEFMKEYREFRRSH